jgi:hypothetical protein
MSGIFLEKLISNHSRLLLTPKVHYRSQVDLYHWTLHIVTICQKYIFVLFLGLLLDYPMYSLVLYILSVNDI